MQNDALPDEPSSVQTATAQPNPSSDAGIQVDVAVQADNNALPTQSHNVKRVSSKPPPEQLSVVDPFILSKVIHQPISSAQCI